MKFAQLVSMEVVVITGASAGVGRAVARLFGSKGASVGLLARGQSRLEATQREIEALGGKAIAIPTDVSQSEQVENAARRVEAELGPIDIWINNAMVSVFSPFIEMTPEEFHRVTEVTYLGFVYGTYCALKRMIPRDCGTIVQVGSALAYRAIPLQSAYCGAKHAIRGFTDSVRTELLHANSKIHITMVQLPAINTPQFDWVRSRLQFKAKPVSPIYQPEVAAEAIYHAAHHPRRQTYVGTSTNVAIIGNKFAAGLADHYLAKSGFESQQTDEPEDPARMDNLWIPPPGDPGAHGRFDDESSKKSLQLWANNHRSLLLGGALLAASSLLLIGLKKDKAA